MLTSRSEAVDAGRVVDEVGIDAAASQAELDACPLRQPEIAAFPDDLAVQLVGVYAHVVVAAVADVGVTFRAGLDVRADTAVPQQVDGHPEYRPNQFVRLHRRLVGAEHRARFLAEANRLRLPREHAAALRDDRIVVIGPAGARQVEQPLPLLEARGHVGIGVEEDVLVIERGHEPDLA